MCISVQEGSEERVESEGTESEGRKGGKWRRRGKSLGSVKRWLMRHPLSYLTLTSRCLFVELELPLNVLFATEVLVGFWQGSGSA